MTNLSPDTTAITWPERPSYGCNRWQPFYGYKIGTECNLPTATSAATLYNGYEAG